MKRVFVFIILGMILISICIAQSPNAGQRIVGTWTNNEGITWIFRSNGILTIRYDEWSDIIEEFRYSVNDMEMIIFEVEYWNPSIGWLSIDDQIYRISFSPDGITLSLTNGKNLSGVNNEGPCCSRNILTKR